MKLVTFDIDAFHLFVRHFSPGWIFASIQTACHLQSLCGSGFYGLNEKDEMAVEIDKGKTLVVRLTGRTEVDDEGEVQLFFELNGQPCPMRVSKAGLAVMAKAHPKAEEGDSLHAAAPMPGAVAMVAVKPGQK